MKRMLTVFLVLILLATSIYATFPVNAARALADKNLVIGGDFTGGTGYTTNTTIPAASDAFVTGNNYRTWFRASSLANAIGNDSDSYGNYLHTKQYAFYGVPFITGHTYTLSFDIRGNMGDKNVQFYLCDATVRGTALAIGSVVRNGIENPTTDRVIIEKSSNWTNYTVTFKVTAALDSAKKYAIAFYDVDYTSTNAIYMDLDNVSLYDNDDTEVVDESEFVIDGGFESTQNSYTANSSETETLQVLTQQAATATPTNIWHQAQGKTSHYSRITNEEKQGGNASAIVNSYLHQGVAVIPGEVYQLQFWAKARNFNALTFRFVSTDNRAAAINVEGTRTATLTNEWVKYTYTITMPATISGTTLLSFFTKSISDTYANYNANDAYLDNVSLKELYSISATAEEGGTAAVSSPTATYGEQVTFTATPNNGRTFNGWYVEGESVAVSTEAVYTVTVNGNISLIAKFNPLVQPENPNNLLYDGTFTKTTSIVTAESYDTVTFESAHIWYQPPGSSAIQTEGDNNVAKLSQWLYQSIKIEANTSYRLTYKAKNVTENATVGVSVRALKNRATILKTVPNQTIEHNGEWKAYTAEISIGALNPSYTEYTLGLTGTIGAGVLVDDLVLEKLCNITVVTEGSGTATASKNTAALGEEVTFTATPTGGTTFLGWFTTGETSPISTNAVYTTTVTGHISLTAKFSGNTIPEDPDDPDTLLYDGKFTKTKSVVSAESYSTVTFDSAHIWYQPPGSTSIQTNNGNSYAFLSEWMYQSIGIEANTTYLLSFKAKSNVSGKSMVGVIRALKDRSKTLKNVCNFTTDGEGVWKEYAVLFTIDTLLSGYTDYTLGLMGTSGAGVCIDDVVLKKATGNFYMVTAAAFRGGKATASSSVALPGATVTFTATPDNGNTFRGWYEGGNTAKAPVSTNAVYTATVNSNLFLVAVFDGPGIPVENYSFINPGAESGDTTGWMASPTDAALSVTSQEKHSGKNSFKFETTAERRYLTTTEGILLKGYHTYTVSVWLKSSSIYPRVQLFTGTTYSEGQNDFVYEDKIRGGYMVTHRIGGDLGQSETSGYSAKTFTKTPDKYAGAINGWVLYEMTFSTKSSDAGTVVKFCIRNNSGTGVLYLDDLKVTETPVDIYASKTDKTYCQWIYNEIANSSFEDKTTESDWGSTLPSGWSIKSSGGALGSKYLSLSGANVFYKKIAVTPDTEYHLGVSLKAAAKNGSFVAIAKDQNGTLFHDINGKSASFLTPVKYNGGWERVGFKFTTPEDVTEVYLMIANPSGELSVDNICYFKGKYAYSTDPNDYTVRVGYDYDGIGYVGDDEDIDQDVVPGGESAHSLAVTVCLLTALAWVMYASRKKEQEEV